MCEAEDLGAPQVGSQHSPPDPGPCLCSDLSFFHPPGQNSLNSSPGLRWGVGKLEGGAVLCQEAFQLQEIGVLSPSAGNRA